MSKLKGHPLESFIDATGPDTIDPKPTMLPTLIEANIIIGRDVVTEVEFVVYGREILTEIARGGTPIQRPLCIEIRRDRGELELLCAMVRFVKGRDDYPH